MVYEPEDVYRQRNQAVADFLSRYRQPAPPQPGGVKGFVGKGLDYLNRPLAGTSSALAAGLRGESPWEGFKAGVTGRSDITNIEDVLKQEGVGELGGVNVFGKRLTGRGALGFLGSAATDPVTLATIPFGVGGSALMRGTKAVLPGAAKAIESTPIVRGLAGAGPVTKAAQPIEALTERAAQEAQVPLNWGERGMRAPAGIPKIGNAYLSAIGVLNPKVAAGNDPLKRIMLSFKKVGTDLPSMQESIVAPVEAIAKQSQRFGMGDSVLGPLDEYGRMTLTNGEQIYAPFALEQARFRQFLTPEQQRLADEMAGRWKPIYETAKRLGVKMEDYDLPEGDQFIARVRDVTKEESRYGRRVALTEKGAQKARDFDTPEQAWAAQGGAAIYLDPVQGYRQRVGEMLEAIANVQLAKQLEPLARRQNLELLAGMKEAAKTAGARVGGAEILRQMVQRVRRGEVPTQAQIKATGKAFPELQEQLEAAMALGPRDFEQAIAMLADDVQAALGVTPERLTQAITAARERRVAGGLFDVGERGGAPAVSAGRYPMQSVTRVDLQQALKDIGKEDRTSLNLIEDIYRNAYRLNKEERANALQAVVDSVKETKTALREEAQEIGGAYKWARAGEAAKIAGRREVERTPGLREMWFKPEDAAEIERALGTATLSRTETNVRGALGLAENISASMRTSMAAMDLSALMIQGLGFLARHPAQALEGFVKSIGAAIDPNATARFMARPDMQEVAQAFPGLYWSKGTSEFFAGKRPLEWAAGKVPLVGGALREGISQGIGRGSAAFDFLGNFMRGTEAKGMMKLAKETGNIAQAEEFLNKLTGVHVVAGIPETWNMLEGSMLFFAKRYTRSSMAFVIDAATRGDFVGAEARATLANMLAGGVAWYSHLAEAVGQEPNLDPTTGKFLTIKVGDDNVGIGSIWVSMARFLGNAVAHPGEMTPDGWANITRDNPITAWWRSRSAPVGGILWDKLMAGEDYIGTPLDEPVVLAKYLGSKFLPFAFEAYLLQNQPLGVESLPAQLTGLRAFPQSRQQIADTVAQEQFGRPFAELDPTEQAQVERSEKVKNVPIPEGRYGERARALKPVFDTYEDRLGQLAEMLKTDQITKRQFRIEQTEAVKERSVRFETVPQIEPSGRGKPPSAQEQSRKQYLDILYESGDPMGDPQYEEADKFLATLPSSHVAYIKQKSLANIERLPEESRGLMRELWQARQKTAAYFNEERDALKRFGLWDEYSAASPAEKEQLRETPRYKAAMRDADRRQMAMRLRDKELDQALIDWYGRKPVTLTSIRRAM